MGEVFCEGKTTEERGPLTATQLCSSTRGGSSKETLKKIQQMTDRGTLKTTNIGCHNSKLHTNISLLRSYLLNHVNNSSTFRITPLSNFDIFKCNSCFSQNAAFATYKYREAADTQKIPKSDVDSLKISLLLRKL